MGNERLWNQTDLDSNYGSITSEEASLCIDYMRKHCTKCLTSLSLCKTDDAKMQRRSQRKRHQGPHHLLCSHRNMSVLSAISKQPFGQERVEVANEQKRPGSYGCTHSSCNSHVSVFRWTYHKLLLCPAHGRAALGVLVCTHQQLH